jgi:FixJ family two-component response regulator
MKTISIASPRTGTAIPSVYSRRLPELIRENPRGLGGVPSNGAQRSADVLVCIVDSDDSICQGLTQLLRSEKYPTESFGSARLFLRRKIHAGPCCLVVDGDPQSFGGLDLQQVLAKDGRTEQIIFMSGRRDIRACAQALKAGAVDFLPKPLQETELILAVETALLRSGNLLRWRREQMAAQSMLDGLTPREREVLSFVISGKINKEIASELGAGEKTIKKHRGHLMKKLNVGSVAELVHFSYHLGLKPACPYGIKVPAQV